MVKSNLKIGIASLLTGAGAAAALWNVAPAATVNPQMLADAAYQAMGGDRLAAVRTLSFDASLQQWDPGESETPDDPLKPDWGKATLHETRNLARGLVHTEWARPKASPGLRMYSETYSADGGYVVGLDENGGVTKRAIMVNGQSEHTMSNVRLATELREQERNNVIGEMHAHPERIAGYPAQKLGGKTYPAAQYRGDYGTFIVLFDPATHLPAVIRTRDFDQYYGDSNYDEALSDWRDTAGVKLPHHALYTLNGVKIFDVTVNSYTVNPTLPADAFPIPEGLRGKAEKPAEIGKTPYQWVIRRLSNGFYLDTDSVYSDAGDTLKLTDIGPNITMATGATHNTLIVATDKYLVGFETPIDDGLSQWVIKAAAEKYPGKPFRYVILTHHHIDHTGGVRAYAAAGATIVVGKGDGAFFRKVISAPHGLDPYPVKITGAPKVIEVDGKWSINDAGREIDAYLLPNPHATPYVIGYIPDAKLGFVTDIWSPGRGTVTQADASMVALVRGVQKFGIQPERFAGGHGFVDNYSVLTNVVAKTASAAR
ncbi:MAG: MBL fold metallo-hydrolase [Alphaproteobacteria bacterium]|nr:MBL fold metallo-hydrolase [Alphaproteobacteria bacterium]